MPMGSRRAETAAALVEDAQYVFCTPEECVERIVAYVADTPISRFYILGGLPGLDFEVSRGWVELFRARSHPPFANGWRKQANRERRNGARRRRLRGMGHASAVELARRGFQTVLVGYVADEESALAAAEEVAAQGTKPVLVRADASTADGVTVLTEAARAEGAALDAVVYAAGYRSLGPSLDLDEGVGSEHSK